MNINELIKGIIIGIAKIIPGLSGAVLMISFNLYDRAIEAITTFFEHPKKNFLFLMNLGIGIILGIVLFSKVISFFITRYYLYTTALFIGLIVGGIPMIKDKTTKKRTNQLFIVISFALMTLLTVLNPNHIYVLKNNYTDLLVFFLAGLLEAIGTILPGISSTALLMLIGVYNSYINILSNALNPIFLKETIYYMLPFSIGMFLGIILLSVLVNYLFKSYKEQTFAIILGISLSSCFSLLLKIIPHITSITSVVISLLLLGIGYIITNKLT